MLARELEKNELAPSKRNYADTIKSYLLEHYREPIEIDRLAKLIHRSPSYAAPSSKRCTVFHRFGICISCACWKRAPRFIRT